MVRVTLVPWVVANAPAADVEPALAEPLALSLSLGIPLSCAPFALLRSVPALVAVSFCEAVGNVVALVCICEFEFVSVAGPAPVPVSDPPLADPVPAEVCEKRLGVKG